MTILQIILALLPIFQKAAPELVKDIALLIHGNPQAQGETDDAYVARLGTLIDADVSAVEAEDKDIQGS